MGRPLRANYLEHLAESNLASYRLPHLENVFQDHWRCGLLGYGQFGSWPAHVVWSGHRQWRTLLLQPGLDRPLFVQGRVLW